MNSIVQFKNNNNLDKMELEIEDLKSGRPSSDPQDGFSRVIQQSITYLPKFDFNLTKKYLAIAAVTLFSIFLCLAWAIVFHNLLSGDKHSNKDAELIEKHQVFQKFPTAAEDDFLPKIDPETEMKREFVKEMMLDSWNVYAQYAWGDEAVSPVSKIAYSSAFGKNSGLTLVSSMSTLWTMGLSEEFERGRKWIEAELNLSKVDKTVLVFDVVTHYVGGLLSCYALTNDSMFLGKALEIAQLVQPAFNTPSGIPYEDIALKSRYPSDRLPYLSYFGGFQLDFNYLSDASDNSTFRNQIMQIQKVMLKVGNRKMKFFCNYGMDVMTGLFSCSSADLFTNSRHMYTNLVRTFIQSNYRDVQSIEMYKEALDKMEAVKMFAVASSGLHYARRYHTNGVLDQYMEYSGCYLGAMLSLGANAMQRALKMNSSIGQSEKNKEFYRIYHHHVLAEKLTETCHVASEQTRTGFGPASFIFNKTEGVSIIDSRFYLSPEFAESNFVLWRLTQDRKYRESAWEMAQAIKRFCKVESGGYSTIGNVDKIPTDKTNHQPAHFLSATLKYLYLTFTDDDVLPLDQWVFNAQGHPLPICGNNTVYQCGRV